MKKNVFRVLLATCFVGLLSVVVFAQPGPGEPPPGGPGGPGGRMGRGPEGPGGPRGGMGIGMLLRSDEIKSRLQLTEEQTGKLQKLAEDMRGQTGRTRPGRQRGDGERPSQADFERMQAEMQKQQDEMQKKVNEILTSEQQVKFKELAFQMAGGLDSRMLNARMLDVVNLSEEQKAKLKGIEEERNREFREMMEKNRSVDIRGMTEEQRRDHFTKMRSEGEAVGKKYSEKITAVLSPEQLEKAKTLTEEGKSLRPARPGRPGDPPPGERDPEGGYRPGSDSWQPGQGAQRRDGNRQRRAFPKSDTTE